MGKRRYVVTKEFEAWTPDERENPETHVLLKQGSDLFADTTPGDFITLEIDNLDLEFEAERSTFSKATRLWDADHGSQ